METLMKGSSKILNRFKQNFMNEYNSNSCLKNEIKKISKYTDKCKEYFTPIRELSENFNNKILKNLNSLISYKPQISNSLLENEKEWFKKPIKIPDSCSKIQTNKSISNYIPGILRNVINFPQKLISNRFQNVERIFNDFYVLTDIEKNKVKNLIIEIFKFSEPENITAEAYESLKRMREELSQKSLKNTEVIPVDLRKTNIEKVYMKNNKKTIKCSFELTTVTKGVLDHREQMFETNLGCIVEFIKEGSDWVANSFSYSLF